jgi:uncharacterized RDD family membrane protein YckC
VSAAGFTARYAAYSADLALLAVPVTALAWSPLQRLVATWRTLAAQTQAALDRAFASGHFALLDLTAALRADAAFMAAMSEAVGGILAALATAAALGWVAVAAYFVGFEASRWQATPGKRALGLRVTAPDGGAAGVGRIALRFIAAGPSWLLLHLGHALVAFRDDDRAAHDLLAGTRVSGAPAVLPVWARAWLAAQTVAVLLLLGWVAWSVVRAALLLGL